MIRAAQAPFECAYSLPRSLRAWSRKAYDRAERVRREASVGFFNAPLAQEAGGALITASGGGGPSASPTFIAAGTGSNATSPTPAYGTNASGDLFIMQAVAIGSGSTFTRPAGWSLIAGSPAIGNYRQYAWSRDARSTGSESGTVSVTGNSTTNGQAVIYTIRTVATNSFSEAAGVSSGTGLTLSVPSITTLGAHRMVVLFCFSDAGINGMSAATGETGGTYVEATPEFTSGVGPGSQLQTADMPSAGTISGGTVTYTSGGTPTNISIVFALIGV